MSWNENCYFMKIVVSNHWEEVSKDEFWQFDEKLKLENLLREPAYIFLEMVSISCILAFIIYGVRKR